MLPDTPKSLLPKVAAWLFIVVGTFSTIITLLQNAMVRLFFPKEDVAQQFANHSLTDQFPAIFNLLFSYFDYFFIFALLASLITCISAIALLIQKKWARIVFIGLMTAGIAWNLGSLFLQLIFFNNLPEIPAQGLSNLQTMQNIIFGASFAMSLAFTALFVWTIAKLRSRQFFKEILRPARA